MDLLVAADDRTGAYEVAAAMVAAAGPVPVGAWPTIPSAPTAVVDLASRHLNPSDARDRAAAIPDRGRQAHKIDSTLRGNWADELVGRAATAPVLLVPALPAEGRTCVGGVVLELGRPVHEGMAGSDVRRRVLTSRPADALRAAGASEVIECADAGAVAGWLVDPSGIAVADAADDDAIGELAREWSDGPAVVIAGTSAVVGAAATALAADAQPAGGRMPALEEPVLIVCGSVHPVARRQLDAAARRGVPVATIGDEFAVRALQRDGVLALVTEIPVGDVAEPMAVAAAATLARGVEEVRSRVALGAIVVIGGDTAAAVLGAATATVRGWAAPGAAWVDVPGCESPVVTRSGGFGSDGALLELLDAVGARR